MDQSRRRMGESSAPIHHGEVLQGMFRDRGTARRGLVTLPCPLYCVRARFASDGMADVTVSPGWRTKARTAARLALSAYGLPPGGHLEISSDVPLGRGFGSSTSDVLAAIGAVQDRYALRLTSAEKARLAVRAEIASDSMMFESTAVLFAQREGEVIEDFGHPLPAMFVLGFGSRPAQGGRGVDTLSLPPARYTDDDVLEFAELRAMLREAVLAKDVALLGHVATASTRLNQRHLPVPQLDRILNIVQEARALGLQISHSGDVAGLLFDRDDPALTVRSTHAEELLRDIGIVESWKFATNG
ncbi:kinase [Streptomyces sp. NPDC094034]|uniref:GHMP family kinase ATP-binding protein n=1 Tax=Streptomyces sp. NPDC094034 TaxID=3155309 RepID=UPI00332A5897